MESSIPVVDGSMVAAKGKFEVVVIVVANDRPLDIRGVAGRLSSEAKFAEVGHLLGQRRSHMEHKLSQVETTERTRFIGCREVHVGESVQLHGWKVRLCNSSIGMLVMHMCG